MFTISLIIQNRFNKMEVNIYFNPEEIQHEYDYVCKRINLFGRRIPLYDFLMGYWERKSNRVLVNHIESSDSKDIIQLGLGTGYLMGLLCKKYPNSRFRGSDLSPGMIDCTQDHLLKRGHTKELSNQTISLNVEDCRSLPICDNSYDLAITSYLVDLMPPQDILSVLEEIKRILKPCLSG